MDFLVLLVIFMPRSREQADSVHAAVKGAEVLFICAFSNNAPQPFFPACLCSIQDLSEAVFPNLSVQIKQRLLSANKGSPALHSHYARFRCSYSYVSAQSFASPFMGLQWLIISVKDSRLLHVKIRVELEHEIHREIIGYPGGMASCVAGDSTFIRLEGDM
ncbi:hypothetical protein D3C76_1061930 [compost metagenome]